MITNIFEIACGVILAKIIIGVVNESYWYKWKRVRLELKRICSGSKRHKKEVQVPRKSKESTKGNVPLLQNFGRGKATGKYAKSQERCPFPRFFNPPN